MAVTGAVVLEAAVSVGAVLAVFPAVAAALGVGERQVDGRSMDFFSNCGIGSLLSNIGLFAVTLLAERFVCSLRFRTGYFSMLPTGAFSAPSLFAACGGDRVSPIGNKLK